MERQLKFVKEFDWLEQFALSEEKIFKYFFFHDKKILYVVDAFGKLEGIVTLKDFLKYAGSVEKALNRKYHFIRTASLDDMCFEAQQIYDKYKIQTSIPVIDAEQRMIGYITDTSDSLSKWEEYRQQIQDAKEKIERFMGSYYLKKEIDAFCEVMAETKIYIRQCDVHGVFSQIFSLFKKKIKPSILSDKEYLKKVDRLIQNESSDEEKAALLFDFEPGNRELFYDIKGITSIYNLQKFMQEFTTLVEDKEFSRILRITRTSDYQLKEFIADNGMENIKFAAHKLLSGYIYRYMHENNIPIALENITHLAAMETSCLVNGIRGNCQDIIGFTYCDLSERQRKLAEALQDKGVFVFHLLGAVKSKMTESERGRVKNLGRLETLIERNDLESLQQLYGEDCGEKTPLEYAKEIWYHYPVRRRFENDIIVNVDFSSQYVNFENGIRKTCYQPEEYSNTIYFTGPCFALGSFVEDKHTIPSLLAKKLQKEGWQYRVVNLGMLAVNDEMEWIRAIPFDKGDILVNLYYTEKSVDKGNFIDASRYFDMNADRGDCFFDKSVHANRKGNEIYADAIYGKIRNVLKRGNEKEMKKNSIYNIFNVNRTDFHLYGIDEYLEALEKRKKEIPPNAKSIGSIVMNANPFTLGHRCLVEYASRHCDYLFVFVVEEEKSFFQFDDRMEMVKNGCRDIQNICVLSSGKMIVSDLTLPEYFKRESIRDEVKHSWERRLNTSTDLVLFARYIAPAAGITMRFVATEPLDELTQQYNRGMKEILTSFGICLVEIPRKTSKDGEIISASKVRKAYKKKEFDKMREMLPVTTYDYLLRNQEKYITK